MLANLHRSGFEAATAEVDETNTAALALFEQSAGNRQQALDYLRCQGEYSTRVKENPAVLLLDLKLPKVDGLEVLRRIKSDPRTMAIPVVVLTSSREQRDVVETYRLGVNSYIVKPVNFEGFFTAVQELGMYWLLLNQSPKLDA